MRFFPGRSGLLLVSLACALVAVGCGDSDDSGPTGGIEGVVGAGPTCPVATDPPDPACAPLPVASAEIAAENLETGARETAVTDSEGQYLIEIEVGQVRVTPGDVEGLMGTPAPVDVTLTADQRQIVDLTYDTGIR